MGVNFTKTKVVVFNIRLANNVLPFVFNANDVPINKQYTYLGAIFSDGKDRFRENYEVKYGKVLRAIYASRIPYVTWLVRISQRGSFVKYLTLRYKRSLITAAKCAMTAHQIVV